MSDLPVFVVVGNVNQGKSSVVAALSENATVPVDSYPGTTIKSGSYLFRIGSRELFRIVDTPGFQDARRVLHWLQQHASHPGERVAAVRAFVDEYEGTGDFQDEVELLRPVLDGAGVLYVVDASSRFQPSNEAEMEILRWTGQPGMALINRTRERDHTDEWRPVLEQFFNVVRVFDAHGARFDDRLRLLQGFAEIRDAWREPVEAAVSAMRQEWADRRRQAAAAIATMVVGGLGHVDTEKVDEGADEKAIQAKLGDRYRDALRAMEARSRARVEEIYRHDELDRSGDRAFELLDEDLFSESAWKMFGLTRTQLATRMALWGAAAGAGVDLFVGGASFFLGAAIGGAAGAAMGFFGLESLSKVWGSRSALGKALLPDVGGHFVGIGPVKSPRFAWVLLDRALVHQRAVADRSHARRDGFTAGDQPVGIVANLPKDVRDRLDAALRDAVDRAGKRKDLAPSEASLAHELGQLLV